LSPWLHRGLERLGLKMVLLETRHLHAALKAQGNKTDKNDALGVAQLVRSGWYRDVHVKSEASYRLRLLLTPRRALKHKFLDLENEIRHSLKVFGVKLSAVGRVGFEARVRELIGGDALLAALTEPVLRARAALWSEYSKLHALLVRTVGRDELCQRFMAVPGVGPAVALTFKTTVDDPARFKRSRDVGAYAGLTSKRIQSGDSIDYDGHISRQGDGELRTALYEAASGLVKASLTGRGRRNVGLVRPGSEDAPRVRPCSKASIADRDRGVGTGVGLSGTAWPNY
jgi:transposase